MMREDISEALVELNEILKYTSKDILDKIPTEFIKFIQKNASTTYKFNYDFNEPLEKQQIKFKTKVLIALIYRDYVCNTEEKKDYMNYISYTLSEIEKEKQERYNSNNIFKNKINEEDKECIENNLPLEVKKENIIIKIIYFIKNIFNK